MIAWLRALRRRGDPKPQVIPTRHGWLHKLGWAFGISEFS